MSAFFNTNGQILTSPKEIANSFNAYFSNIGNELAKKITPTNFDFRKYLKGSVPNSMFLSSVTSEEIISISKTIKSSHSTDCDGIDPTLASISVPLIAHILASLINCSFNSGTFPDSLKTTKVIPLPKADSKDIITNYRPISLLPYFSKYFEKAVYSRTVSFFDKFSIIKDNQFGFRQHHSTYMSLSIIHSKIAHNLERVNPQLESFWTWLKLLIRWITTFCLRNYSIMASEINAYCLNII